MNRYYQGEPVNIHIQSSINILQDNNRVITTKKGKGKLPLFRGNEKRVIPIYASRVVIRHKAISEVCRPNVESKEGVTIGTTKNLPIPEFESSYFGNQVGGGGNNFSICIGRSCM